MRILLSLLLILLFVPEWSGSKRLQLLGRTAHIVATPVVFDAADPQRTRAGRLRWLGGVRLTSLDPAFGGYSALQVRGDRFTLLSDGGNIVRFTLGKDWRLRDPSFANLLAGPRTGWQKSDRDVESMTTDPATGDIWLGFESANMIWRYDASLTRVRGKVTPPAMAKWSVNGGAESMVRLRDGSIVVLAETDRRAKIAGRSAVRFFGDPVRAPRGGYRFSYLPPHGYNPSDATLLPDGRILVLNRKLGFPYGFAARLTIVDPQAIGPGKVVGSADIATLERPLIHDNFEGIAITREGAATIVWIVSDDNQSLLQRTLLLKFRLEPGA